jgi:hypothetical protein
MQIRAFAAENILKIYKKRWLQELLFATISPRHPSTTEFDDNTRWRRQYLTAFVWQFFANSQQGKMKQRKDASSGTFSIFKWGLAAEILEFNTQNQYFCLSDKGFRSRLRNLARNKFSPAPFVNLSAAKPSFLQLPRLALSPIPLY